MEEQTSLLRSKRFWGSCLAVAIVAELVTVGCRLCSGLSAAEFHAQVNMPVILRIHHMFWAVPLALVGLLLLKRRNVARSVFGVSAGILLSDLVHHFIVLPIWVGNTGWHWP